MSDIGSQELTVEKKQVMAFGKVRLEKTTVQAGLAVILLSFVGLTIFLRQTIIYPDKAANAPQLKNIDHFSADKPETNESGRAGRLIKQLKELNLWDISPAKKIPAAIISGYPANLHKIVGINIKKKVFINTMLPVVLIARQEVEKERETLRAILAKIETTEPELVAAKFDFSAARPWRRLLSTDEILFLDGLVAKYRTNDIDELLDRVNIVPVSLVLGQGAIESSWGGSRFARVGNNLFGIWTWGGQGIIPAQRDAGRRHKIKIYNSILDSVRDYILTINRLAAYSRFRMIRRQTLEPIALAEGLTNYSERRAEYVRDLKRVIILNNLQDYDSCVLRQSPRPIHYSLRL